MNLLRKPNPILSQFIMWPLVSFVVTTTLYASVQTKDQEISDLISKMSSEEKAGQFLMLGISENELTPSLKKFLNSTKPGFIVLFKKNIQTPLQTSKLTHDIQSYSFSNSGISTAFAIDQEGGDVVRIPTYPPIPTALAMGRSRDEDSILNIGYEIGKSLKLLGISINLAPVLDISSPVQDSFIQTRSFGDSPQLVSMMARQFSMGLNKAQVAATAKHFPGLGSSIKDTHKSAVISQFTKEEIKEFLKPYKDLINKNAVQAIMLTHLIYPNLDSEQKPATFSPAISKLAREIGFNGIIMTDDIEMAGAHIYKTPGKRVIEAFKAGSDVIMVAWNKKSQSAAHKNLAHAIQNNEIPEVKIQESLYRILKFKKEFGLLKLPSKVVPHQIMAQIKNEELGKSVDQVFKKLFQKEILKLSKANVDLNLSNVLVVSNNYSVFKQFKKEFQWNAKFAWAKPEDLKFKILNKSSLILFHVSSAKSAQLLSKIDSKIKSRILVLNSTYPGNVEESQFLEVLQISMKHPDLGSNMGKWLTDQKKLREPASNYVLSRPKEN